MLAATGAIRKAFAQKPGEIDPRYYFGQAGHACDYEASAFGPLLVAAASEAELTVAWGAV